jgi:hypothetical protein
VAIVDSPIMAGLVSAAPTDRGGARMDLHREFIGAAAPMSRAYRRVGIGEDVDPTADTRTVAVVASAP